MLHDEAGIGDDAMLQALGDTQNRMVPFHHLIGTDSHNGDPKCASQCPLHNHGSPVDALVHVVELPAKPHRAPACIADLDCWKLLAAVIMALEDLPLCPSTDQLRGMKFAELQILTKTNGVPQPNNATVKRMMHQLCAWLAEDDARMLELPRGI